MIFHNNNIDVNTSLSSIIEYNDIPSSFSHCSSLSSITMKSTYLRLYDKDCNSAYVTSFDVSAMKYLSYITVGNENLYYTNKFIAYGLPMLKTIEVGGNSFTKSKKGHGYNSDRSFSVKNCEKLESIDIGPYSFSDYAGYFELQNLPSLKYLEIGDVHETSGCFYYCRFQIRGNHLFLQYCTDLPKLRTIELGYDSFATSLYTVFESIIDLDFD